VLGIARDIYTDWLWFDSVGYVSVYATVLKTRVVAFLISALLFAALFLGNLMLAARLVPKGDRQVWPWAIVRRLQQASKVGVILATIFLSIIFGLVAQNNWQLILRFLHQQPFGVADPLFSKDVGFYVFSLPFFQFMRGWLLGALILSLLGTIGLYFLSYSVQRLRFDTPKPVMAHAGGLIVVILGLFAWGYRLGVWELVFSARGVVFGATYADVNATLPGLWLLVGVVAVTACLIVAAIVRRRARLALYGIGGWLVVAVVAVGIVPALVQRFQVEPNELARERPYIGYNIDSTRRAFALDRIEEKPFPAEEMPAPESVTQNEGTISNVRLWDHRPLKDTYEQLHSIRLYYDFNDVDVDRYMVNGEYREVMLSARELSGERLAGEAQTWVNRKLQFTHGYGVVMSPVTEVTPQGLPVLWIENIPPVGVFDIERPEIYYGEKTNDYVMVRTRTDEFDYPKGDQNVYAQYGGESGVHIGSLIRRAAYAWEFSDINILISGELTSDSRLLYSRNVRGRIRRLVPFLELDADPYVVVMDGGLFWIQDCYTTTDRYPYSEPVGGGLNYIRNSVKAVVNAYDGSVTFYVADPEDAMVQTYSSVFPGLFVPADQMPDGLRAHWRYPESLFNIQASVYRSYHMQDVRVFYNKEDLWEVPQEFYRGQKQQMEPYYVIMRLPEQEREEFVLMLPFTPSNKNNAIGWLAARCDGEQYGTLLAYRFPKERVIKGPSQIEDRIQQDTIITEQFALWARGGSQVIRGNLLLIPLGESKMYVEPVFLQAQDGGLPELKRVIVAAGERIVMKPTLEESLAAIFGEGAAPEEPEEESPEPGEPGEGVSREVAELIQQAQAHYSAAQEYLRKGDWANYGTELEELESVLRELGRLTGAGS
jgi:hypothetical protein